MHDIGVVKGAITAHSVARASDKDTEKSIKPAIKSSLLVINEAGDYLDYHAITSLSFVIHI